MSFTAGRATPRIGYGSTNGLDYADGVLMRRPSMPYLQADVMTPCWAARIGGFDFGFLGGAMPMTGIVPPSSWAYT